MNAANCGYPTSVDDLLRIIDYEAPKLEGSHITFICHPEYVFIGPNTSICMGNGEWEPDPKTLKCKGIVILYSFSLLVMIIMML